MTITSKIEFDNVSATLCARMVSTDCETRIQAAKDAKKVLSELPKFLRNSAHCSGEIGALETLISRTHTKEITFEQFVSGTPGMAETIAYANQASRVQS